MFYNKTYDTLEGSIDITLDRQYVYGVYRPAGTGLKIDFRCLASGAEAVETGCAENGVYSLIVYRDGCGIQDLFVTARLRVDTCQLSEKSSRLYKEQIAFFVDSFLAELEQIEEEIT